MAARQLRRRRVPESSAAKASSPQKPQERPTTLRPTRMRGRWLHPRLQTQPLLRLALTQRRRRIARFRSRLTRVHLTRRRWPRVPPAVRRRVCLGLRASPRRIPLRRVLRTRAALRRAFRIRRRRNIASLTKARENSLAISGSEERPTAMRAVFYFGSRNPGLGKPEFTQSAESAANRSCGSAS